MWTFSFIISFIVFCYFSNKQDQEEMEDSDAENMGDRHRFY